MFRQLSESTTLLKELNGLSMVGTMARQNH